jgi:hypothetical protein
MNDNNVRIMLNIRLTEECFEMASVYVRSLNRSDLQLFVVALNYWRPNASACGLGKVEVHRSKTRPAKQPGAVEIQRRCVVTSWWTTAWLLRLFAVLCCCVHTFRSESSTPIRDGTAGLSDTQEWRNFMCALRVEVAPAMQTDPPYTTARGGHWHVK